MIRLTDIGGTEFYLNPDLIEKMEHVPDTVLTLTTGKRVMIRETPDVVPRQIIAFRQRCFDLERKIRDCIDNSKSAY
ncbi:MAG: flagellar protein FlbD [Lentisphaerae bacterium]|nr:MAG: flagellar protein FlbD [Lentisphaerota bacterium]